MLFSELFDLNLIVWEGDVPTVLIEVIETEETD